MSCVLSTRNLKYFWINVILTPAPLMEELPSYRVNETNLLSNAVVNYSAPFDVASQLIKFSFSSLGSPYFNDLFEKGINLAENQLVARYRRLEADPPRILNPLYSNRDDLKFPITYPT